MPMKNNINGFIQKNASSCRIFWGFMCTVFFTVAWVSLYSTDVGMGAEKSKVFALTSHVALGLLLYSGFLFMGFPLVYLLHNAIIKERLDNVKLVWGAQNVDPILKFLTNSVFPMICVYMRENITDVASLWACVGGLGSVFCLIICYADPEDYGISDAFLALGMGILVNMNHLIGKCIVIGIVVASMSFSREIELRKNKE